MPNTMSLETIHGRYDNKLLKKLHGIILEKKSNLCVAADLDSIDKTLRLIDKIGDHICILKIHCEHFGGNLEENLKILYGLKRKHNFLLFEDRKFYDGGQTIQKAYEQMYARYVDLVTVVPSCGDAIFKAIEDGAKNIPLPEDEFRGCLAVCELSFAGVVQLNSEDLLAIAERNSPICCGIIGQKLRVKDKSLMIKATPGVHIGKKSDGLNQQWRTPEEAISDGADVIIVGRGITEAAEEDWLSVALQYKERCFQAYQQLQQQQQAPHN